MAEASPGARIGRTLRTIREERLLSRPVLAERAGVHFITIDHIERGFVARPRRTTLEKLAGPLGVTVEELVGGTHPLAPVPPLVLAAMYGEEEEGIRHRALDAASEDELARYLRDIDGQVDWAVRELQSPEGQRPGNKRPLRRYIRRLLDLRDEAEPDEAEPPPFEEMAADHASVEVGA